MAQLYADDTQKSAAAWAVALFCGAPVKTEGLSDSISAPYVDGPDGVLSEPAAVINALAASTPSFLGVSDDEKGKVGSISTKLEYGAAAPAYDGSALKTLNDSLVSKVFLAGGASATLADVLQYSAVRPSLSKLKEKDLANYPDLVRWFNHVQHQPPLRNASARPATLPLLTLKRPNVLVEIETEKAAAAKKAAGGGGKGDDKKGDGKQQQQQQQEQGKKGGEGKQQQQKKPKKVKAPPPVDTSTPFSHLDIRVGRIISAEKHPEADTLYVEKIDVGEESGPRTIVSGLVKFVPLEEMQNRMCIILANLKPAKLRGIASHGMVLCASDDDHTKVDIVDPPAGAVVGERVTVAGYEGDADRQLPPKKKYPELCYPDLKTNDKLQAEYKGIPLLTSAGPLTTKNVQGGIR